MKLSGKSPKSQKGSETVRAQKAQKLSGRSLKRSGSPKKRETVQEEPKMSGSPKKCRDFPGGAPKKRSKRPRSPQEGSKNCLGGAQKGPETVREEPKKFRNWKKAQKLSGTPNKHETVQEEPEVVREEPQKATVWEEPNKAQKLSGRSRSKGGLRILNCFKNGKIRPPLDQN